jgi:hypothetical protein
LRFLLGTLALVIIAAGCTPPAPDSPLSAAAALVDPNVGRWERHFQTKPMWEEYYDLRADGTFQYFNAPKHTASGTWRSAANGVELYVAEENGQTFSPAAKVMLTRGPQEGMLTFEQWRHYCKQPHPHEAVAARASSAPGTATSAITYSSQEPKRGGRSASQEEIAFRDKINAITRQHDEGLFSDESLTRSGVRELWYDEEADFYLITYSGDKERAESAVESYMKKHGVSYQQLKADNKLTVEPYCGL